MANKHITSENAGKKGMTVKVRRDDMDGALRALGKRVNQEGVKRELKEREFYEKPSEKRKRKREEAIKSHRREQAARREQQGF